MSDSTLHIGTLASNNVNNIVNDTSKYDEYKEKVKELEKELQTRKDTFEKMTEPLVYVCDCYQKFNVVTGMPKSTFGDSFGYAMQKEISDYMQDFYAGKALFIAVAKRHFLRQVCLYRVQLGLRDAVYIAGL